MLNSEEKKLCCLNYVIKLHACICIPLIYKVTGHENERSVLLIVSECLKFLIKF